MENHQSSINPWKSIWLSPRKTVQHIIDTNPEQSVIVLAGLNGFTQALGQIVSQDNSESIGYIFKLTLALFLGPLFGIIGLYIFAALTSLTGKWLGGVSSSLNIRAAISWSYVPNISILLLWVPLIILFAGELFESSASQMATEPGPAFGVLLITIASVILGVWSFILSLKCLSQVQQFSVWRALVNFILAMLMIAIPVLIIVFLTVGVAA